MNDSSTDQQRSSLDLRVPILRRLEEYQTDPDHVRGAKYANLLLGETLGKNDVVHVIHLDHVQPQFFERVEEERDLDPDGDELYAEFKQDPSVICLRELEDLPPEFVPATPGPGGRT